MVKEREQLAEAILNHALEIICLLTVEDYIIVKRPNGTRCAFSICATEVKNNTCDSTSGCPELSFTLLGMEDKTQRMIAQLANKIIQLLTREVKCGAVSVKDEREYLEGHGAQSKNSQGTFTIEQPKAPFQRSTAQSYPIKFCIKEEPKEKPHSSTGFSEAFEKYALPVQRENLSNMVKEREQLAEAILNHALEIICLLTVEDFIVVKRPDGTRCSYSICATDTESSGCDSPSGCPELSFTLMGMRDKTQKMIAELAKKIVHLLAKKVPIKCEDVAIYFCKDEEEYLEGHGEQSKNSLDTCSIDQSTETNDPINLCIKEEREEEPHHSAESPQFVPSPEQEHVYITHHIKEEAEESQDLYMSVSEDPVSPAECMYKDKEYLPPKTNNKSSGTHKSRLEKPSFSCEECGKVLGSKSTLDKHLLIHTGQRPYPCNECEKSFSCKNHLDAHKRSHTGERPFACKQCDRRFFNQQHLVLHQVVHTGEKPYSCPVCGKGFTRQSSVVKHSSIHAEQKPFVCNECGKSYCQYASLVVHQRQHSGEKPFVCKYCDQAFPCKATMLKHEKSHTGEKPFPCPQCNKCFIDKCSMTKHKRKVHAKEPKPANRLGMESDHILVTM